MQPWLQINEDCILSGGILFFVILFEFEDWNPSIKKKFNRDPSKDQKTTQGSAINDQ